MHYPEKVAPSLKSMLLSLAVVRLETRPTTKLDDLIANENFLEIWSALSKPNSPEAEELFGNPNNCRRAFYEMLNSPLLPSENIIEIINSYGADIPPFIRPIYSNPNFPFQELQQLLKESTKNPGLTIAIILNPQITQNMFNEILDKYGNILDENNSPSDTKNFEAIFGEISRDARLPYKYVELALSSEFYKKYGDNYMDDVLENPQIPPQLFERFLDKDFTNGAEVADMLMKVAVHPNCPVEISATLIKRILEGKVTSVEWEYSEEKILRRLDESRFDTALLEFGFTNDTLKSMPLLMKAQTLSSWGF